ncbi:hypothetical protein PIROE2DRAFT_3889, partial [Piromyces sp. E2]
RKTVKRKKTKNNSKDSNSVLASTSNTPVVLVPKLNSIIEHEFANKRVTRSMQQEAKKIKREILRKERKKNKQIIYIEISDDDDNDEAEKNTALNENKNKKLKLKSNDNVDTKKNKSAFDSTDNQNSTYNN